MQNRPRVLIAGCGDVGSALAGILLEKNREVHAIRRGRRKLPAGVRGVQADLRLPLPPLPEVDCVVYAVAPDERTPDAYHTTYVTGQARLLDALPEPPALWIFVSSSAVYGGGPGEWVDETTAPAPDNFRGEILLEAEAVARQAVRSHVALRFAGICGPGRSSLRRRACELPADMLLQDRWTNRIHRADCAGLLAHLLERAESGAELPQCLIGVDHLPARYSEVVNFLREQEGLPALQVAHDSEPSGRRLSNAAALQLGYRFRFPDYRSSLLDQ